MKVAHTIASRADNRGGLSRSVPALVSALQCAGVHASVSDAQSAQPLIKNADLVHDHGLWLPANHQVARMSRRSGIPRLVSTRGMLEPWALNHHAWRKRIAWFVYQRRDLGTARVLHATSNTELESLSRLKLKVPVAMIPNAPDAPSPLPPRTSKETRRALFLSRLHPIKGLPLLLEAWARLNVSQQDDWELVVAGPDEANHLAEVMALARQLGIQSSVRFLGPVSDDDKWLLYRSADIFILPSHSESFGLVVAEALAAEVPVITTHGTPWAELEREGCGWWVPVSAEGIVDALKVAIAKERGELEAMGRRGREFVEGRMTWTAVARQMISVYRWMLGDGPLPDCVTMPASD